MWDSSNHSCFSLAQLIQNLCGDSGSYGRTVLDDGQGELALEWWQVAVGAAVTVVALGYLGKIAKAALDEAQGETDAEKLS